jgi:DNA replication and repair protein RecF
MESLFLESIRLLNYRNHSEQKFSFSSKINGILGNNGVGKTSLLDAIYYLSICKSYFSNSERLLVKKGEQQLMVSGQFIRSGETEEILAAWQEGQRKQFKRNGKLYTRLADHIGRIPCVIIAPKDHELIDGSSDLRRRFADQVISQSDAAYLEALMRYNRVLLQRNSLLKEAKNLGSALEDLLEPYDIQLTEAASVIYESRKTFAIAMQELVVEYYQKISGGKELAGLSYESALYLNSLDELLLANRQKDIQAGHTTVGIHKDDLIWLLDGEKLRAFGSQGQQKSFLVSLKLAQFDFMGKRSGFQPIMLLDDIFDKLDAQRVMHLIELVNTHHFGQIFLTDTNRERTSDILQQINEESQIIEVG